MSNSQMTDFDGSEEIRGATDGTPIGNTGDALNVSSYLGEQHLGLIREQNLALANILRMLKKIENHLNLLTEFDVEQNYTEE